MQRYSNLDTVSKTFQKLRADEFVSPDGKAICRSDRSVEPIAPPFKLSQRLDQSTINELIKDYESGKSSYELADTYELNKGSVIKLLREAGVTIRKQGLAPEQVSDAACLYAAGQSLATISAQLGVDAGTVRRALLRSGVKMRDTHGQER